MKKLGTALVIVLLTSCGLLNKGPTKSDAEAGAQPGAAAEPGSLFDFSTAFQASSGSRLIRWRRSGTDAIAEARRTGLPLLILFTSQSGDPAVMMDAALGGSVGLTNGSPQFIPLRLDYSEKITAASEYYLALRNRYQPHGYPVLVVTLPDGSELVRKTGCSADWKDEVDHWLDDAAARARNGTTVHRRRLEKQNYRLWKNRDGAEIFARLESTDANQVVFTSEWGETIHTFINRLSEADQQLIEAGKT